MVDPETGIIYTRRPLDRETLSHYTLRVRAQSDVISASGDSSDVAVVFIQVLDVNDHAPEVTYPLLGSEFHFQQNAVHEGTEFYRLIFFQIYYKKVKMCIDFHGRPVSELWDVTCQAAIWDHTVTLPPDTSELAIKYTCMCLCH